jgi:hypothetical protein
MAGKIFINYRRGDDPQAAGRLFDRLEDVFGREQLFMDVDNIEPGLDFVRVLEEQVAQCDVLISVIGKNWIDARDANGGRRLDNPDDFVRIEIESALAQDKRVIPVLVGQASMPQADEVPESMKPLLRRHAVRLTHERFRADTDALIVALQRALNSAEEARRTAADDERRREEAAEAERREEAARRQAEAERHPAGALAVEVGSQSGSETRFFIPSAGKTNLFKSPTGKHPIFGLLLIGSLFAVLLVSLTLGIPVGSEDESQPIPIQGSSGGSPKVEFLHIKGCRYLEFIRDFPFIGIEERDWSPSSPCPTTDPGGGRATSS